MKRVFIASPYAGDVRRNTVYARAVMFDSLSRGEAPFVPHLLYPQVLNDCVPGARAQGLSAAKAYLKASEMLAVYEDFGVSSGMATEIALAEKIGVPVERRQVMALASRVLELSGLQSGGVEGSTAVMASEIDPAEHRRCECDDWDDETERLNQLCDYCRSQARSS